MQLHYGNAKLNFIWTNNLLNLRTGSNFKHNFLVCHF